jgi:ribosomal protein L7/L12
MAESYTFQNQTLDLIEALKKPFGVTTNAEVISRALALAQVVAEQADDQHTVVVVGKDEPVKVNLTE